MEIINKKGFTNLVSLMLLLLVLSISFISLSKFYFQLKNDIEIKTLIDERPSLLKITSLLNDNSNTSNLFIRSEVENFVIISNVKIDNQKCDILGKNVLLNGLNKIKLNCNFTDNQIYDVSIFSTLGITSKNVFLK